MREEEGGRACRVVGVGLRMHVGVWDDAGRWIRVAGVVRSMLRPGEEGTGSHRGFQACKGQTRGAARRSKGGASGMGALPIWGGWW